MSDDSTGNLVIYQTEDGRVQFVCTWMKKNYYYSQDKEEDIGRP